MRASKPRYRFTCGNCGTVIVVDAGMQELLHEEGCVVCQSEVTDDQFEEYRN